MWRLRSGGYRRMARPAAKRRAFSRAAAYRQVSGSVHGRQPTQFDGTTRGSIMKTTSLLCDTTIAPDGAVVVIEDVGAHGFGGVYVHADMECESDMPRHALWVHTMNADECELAGRLIRVRILSGTADTAGLGELVFDGHLALASGILAVGEAHNPGRQLLFGVPATIHVSVYTHDAVGAVHFNHPPADYAVSGPSDVTVLLHDSPALSGPISNTVVRRPWWRRRPQWPAAPVI